MAERFEDFDMIKFLGQLAVQLGYIPSMDEARYQMAKHVHATYPAEEIPACIPNVQ
jgi:hypothetical protein